MCWSWAGGAGRGAGQAQQDLIQLTCRELGPPFAPSIDPQALGGEDGAGAGEEAALRVGGAGGAGQAGRGLEDPPLLPPELLLAAAQGAGAL